ncbi:pitrilysin family protein [Lewinella sp. JB7]|uniref:M16 family metallopeptidase n=1 Tax=Lewinella sp. JB7 TaxID=2962887 RepID=UPI0020C9EA5F|nr:pitrilysin family protein [Lewinella sp. JB7]MCP9236477.1 insulinase family protein [Lewinella sp. JB7]
MTRHTITNRAAPLIHTPRVPALPPAREWTLSNGLRVVAVEVEQAPILAVEMIWRAGRPYEAQRLVAGTTNALLTEGSKNYRAAELERYFEQYGTALQTPEDMDTANLSVHTILRHAPRLLPVMTEVIAQPSFAPREFKRYLKRSRQQLREDLQDPDTFAYRLLSEAAFGPDNPYGYGGDREDYDALTLEQVRDHYRKYYGAANATLRVVGKLNSEVENLLETTFGQLPAGQPAPAPHYRIPEAAPRLLQHHRPRAQQTMIRRGRRGFRITDPDYPGLCVLETILGGYYGSRLMRNIREEKGYTYGIDTDLDIYRFDGTFGISADVANENVAEVRREILTEMDKLRQDLVPADELDMVRAYLIGGLVMDLDGPLAVSSRYRSAIIKGYDATEHLRRLDETIRNISAEEVRDLAQRYLRPEQDYEVIVGGAIL